MQVDRLSFPCGCSKDGCSNPVGRIEFNPIRVRTHFIHTVMRLEMDRKREQITQMCAPRSTSCDYPQSSDCGDASTHQQVDIEDNCHGDGETQESMDICESEAHSPDRKSVKFDSLEKCSDRDSETEATNSITTADISSQSNSSKSSPKPRKSCLKRKLLDPKNADIVTQYNSNERGSCRDCGNTDVTEMLMAGAHFVESTTPIEMEPIIPSQTKVVDCANTSSDAAPTDTVDASSQQHNGDNSQQQQHFQQVIHF